MVTALQPKPIAEVWVRRNHARCRSCECQSIAYKPELEEIMQNQTPPSLSPLNAAALAPEQKLLIEASASGPDAVKKLSHSRRTAFMAPGLVVKQKGSTVTYLCLGLWPSNSAAGMILLERVELGSQKICFWKLPQKFKCHFKCVFSFADWPPALVAPHWWLRG